MVCTIQMRVNMKEGGKGGGVIQYITDGIGKIAHRYRFDEILLNTCCQSTFIGNYINNLSKFGKLREHNGGELLADKIR